MIFLQRKKGERKKGYFLPGKNTYIISKREKMSLEKCVKDNDIQGCKELLEKGANPNEEISRDFTVFDLTVKNNNIECMKLFIKYGADVNHEYDYYITPLHRAFFDQELMKLLLENGFDVNREQKTIKTFPLHDAVVFENLDSIKMLVEHGASLNVGTSSGKTPLHYAALTKNSEIVLYLLNNGTDVSIKDNYGNTASEVSKSSEIKKLIEEYQNLPI